MATASSLHRETLRTLPSDAARQIQWGFADRYDLQMLLQSARAVARAVPGETATGAVPGEAATGAVPTEAAR